MQGWNRRLGLAAALVVVAAACSSAPSGSPSTAPSAAAPSAAASAGASAAPVPTEYPRAETLYTSGKQWGAPNSWNPIADWAYAMGTLGLVYEPLFTYDPLADKYEPWLAASGEWTGPTEYTIKLRPEATWSDGQPVTADDVVFTLELGKMPSVPYSTIWTYLSGAEAVDPQTVKVSFSSAQYQQWGNFLYNRAVLPKHLWETRTEEQVMGANENPVGSGPYKYLTHDVDRQVWVKNDTWWGKDALGLDPKPTYIFDIVNSSNNAALGQVLAGGIDLSNNFLPGTASLIANSGYDLQTYYDEPPYMLSANTAWLTMNLTKPPLDDAAFRKALAFSVDTDQIVDIAYTGIVTKANSTGLLPPWDKYVDKAVVDDLGFTFDTDKAKQLLADAGYKDTDGDGLVENKDGSKIDLELTVPNGWSDWMASVGIIADNAKAAGINIHTAFPTNDERVDSLQKGTFTLSITNDQQLSNTPWTYYNWMFRQPIQDVQNAGNFGRYQNDQVWSLVQDLDKTATDDVAGMQSVISKIQTIQLNDMPIIPLWYNGAWAQFNNATWTNFPSSGGAQIFPITWNGYWQMGGVKMLDALTPTPPPN
jgi:peptide/nickel transport system substrate-binding protein